MSATPATDELLFMTDEAGIARIVLNRPQARNALTFAMYQGLITCCEAIAGNPAIKALIITGAGEKAFAAGTDIAQFRSFSTAEDALGYERFMDKVLGSLERLRVPTIAAIAGACTGGGGGGAGGGAPPPAPPPPRRGGPPPPCTGGGAAIAAACDLRIATRDARFGFPIARTLGNCLSQGNLKRLSGLIGPARVKDIIFTARLVGAEEALAIGLVGEVVADCAALTERVDTLAQLLANHAPLTMQATKEGLRRLAEEEAVAEGAPHPGDDLILMCYMSQDFREGMEAFLGKRSPNWTGR
jgi:enoyl-CoA hydratase/carnithine racemase